MRLYIAGPMTGIPHFNFPAFDAMAEALRHLGYEVISPAELDDPEDRARAMASLTGDPVQYTYGKTHADFLARDLKIIADQVDGIVVLPGWERSTGACVETFVAYRYGKHISEAQAHDEAGLVLGPVPRLDLFRAWSQERDLAIASEAYRQGYDAGQSLAGFLR